MITKELIEARWKAIIGEVLAVATILLGVFTFDLMKSAISTTEIDSMSKGFAGGLFANLASYGSYVWAQAFSPTGNNGIIIMIVAILLGSSLIAGEVSKGTIFLLLSRPLSRERILLTKYLVGAVVLLAMNLLGGLVLAVATAIAGHPQNLGGIAISVLLFWLGSLFVLGVSTLFSVVFNDVLRPLALTVVVVIVLSLPGFFPNGSSWVLPGYWNSLQAFLGQEFPLKALVISFVAALVPVVAAVPLFKRQAY